MTSPTTEQLVAAEKAIWEFDFDQFALPQVTDAKRDYPEEQWWISELAQRVAEAVLAAG